MGKNTFPILSILAFFFSVEEKKHLLCKLQLFSQNADVPNFAEDFCIYQRTIVKYNNLQTPKKNVIYSKFTRKIPGRSQRRRSGVSIVNLEQISHFVLYFLLPTPANARCGWLLLPHFSCVSYIYLHVQQKQLLSHTKIGDIGVVVLVVD